uniref:Uncharacterized protein n=1 Tax=Micrurus lemniscatus lemniscatus TaxID=129467 RepID=A0A2D4HC17_MICLE
MHLEESCQAAKKDLEEPETGFYTSIHPNITTGSSRNSTKCMGGSQSLVVIWKGQQRQRGRQTLDPQILKEKEYTGRITKELELFFKDNTKYHTSLQNLWDTTKAYIRGLR